MRRLEEDREPMPQIVIFVFLHIFWPFSQNLSIIKMSIYFVESESIFNAGRKRTSGISDRKK